MFFTETLCGRHILALGIVDRLELCSGLQTETEYNSSLNKRTIIILQSKFTAEISYAETTFLDTCIYRGAGFERDAILDVRSHFKLTETHLVLITRSL